MAVEGNRILGTTIIENLIGHLEILEELQELAEVIQIEHGVRKEQAYFKKDTYKYRVLAMFCYNCYFGNFRRMYWKKILSCSYAWKEDIEFLKEFFALVESKEYQKIIDTLKEEQVLATAKGERRYKDWYTRIQENLKKYCEK